jgi:hypothetical protein
MEGHHVGIDLHRRGSTIFQMTEDGEVFGTECIVSLGRLRSPDRRPFGAGGTAACLTENLRIAGDSHMQVEDGSPLLWSTTIWNLRVKSMEEHHQPSSFTPGLETNVPLSSLKHQEAGPWQPKQSTRRISEF